MTPATRDFVAYVGTVFGPYILVFNQTKAANLGPITVNVGADKILLPAHGLSNGTQIRFSTTVALPAPLDPSIYYYVVSALTDDFKISLTSGGAAIDITDSGTGIHTLWRRGIPLDLTGWGVRAWAKHVENWDDSIFIDLAPTILTPNTDGRVQILVDDTTTQTWKYGDHNLSVLLRNTSNDWLGPYLVGKLSVRRASTDSGSPPP
jgi:hypothetical protein